MKEFIQSMEWRVRYELGWVLFHKNKHRKILVSCSDKERNCIQAHGTSCIPALGTVCIKCIKH